MIAILDNVVHCQFSPYQMKRIDERKCDSKLGNLPRLSRAEWRNHQLANTFHNALSNYPATHTYHIIPHTTMLYQTISMDPAHTYCLVKLSGCSYLLPIVMPIALSNYPAAHTYCRAGREQRALGNQWGPQPSNQNVDKYNWQKADKYNCQIYIAKYNCQRSSTFLIRFLPSIRTRKFTSGSNPAMWSSLLHYIWCLGVFLWEIRKQMV